MPTNPSSITLKLLSSSPYAGPDQILCRDGAVYPLVPTSGGWLLTIPPGAYHAGLLNMGFSFNLS
jgi:hypothetical protein